LFVDVMCQTLEQLLAFGQAKAAVKGDRVGAADPAVDQDVAAEDVDLDAGVAGELHQDAMCGAAGLPLLHALGRDVDGQRLLGENARSPGAIAAGTELIEEREFLERRVEL